MTAPGRTVPDGGLVGVLSATPKKAKKGSSYLGLPPVKLPRAAAGRRPEPDVRSAARGCCGRAALVELCRIVPVFCSAALAVLTVGARCARSGGVGVAACWPGWCCSAPGARRALVVDRGEVAARGPAPRG